MKKKKVLILGSLGMLGSMILDVFSKDSSIDVTATVRSDKYLHHLGRLYTLVKFKVFDAETDSLDNLVKRNQKGIWIINAIGIIKPYIHDDNKEEVERAIRVNSTFPYLLNHLAEKTNSNVLFRFVNSAPLPDLCRSSRWFISLVQPT